MKTILLVAIVVLGLVALGYVFNRWETKARAKKLEHVFESRERLTKEQFYERFFKGKGVAESTVLGVREILEEQLGADLSRLSAADDFSKNLSFFWDFDSLADVEIVLALEERFKIKITDREAERTRTVDEIVMLIHSKLSPAHAA